MLRCFSIKRTLKDTIVCFLSREKKKKKKKTKHYRREIQHSVPRQQCEFSALFGIEALRKKRVCDQPSLEILHETDISILMACEDSLEKEIATHSSPGFLPWTEEPGRLQSMGSLRVGHDLVSKRQEVLQKRNGFWHAGVHGVTELDMT